MSRSTSRLAALFLLLGLLAGPGLVEIRAADTLPPGIDWFEGSVEEAFERAKADNRPLFLYWGAVWCPPCVEIRQTVFKSPRFLAQTRLFLPVYLDGDTERAQAWGDRFGTKVYPTMIVFNPAGEEVTRLNASVDVAAYNDVLALSLDNMRPMEDLVRTGMKDPDALSGADLQRLAYYSWSDGKALPDDAEAGLFLRLANAADGREPGAGARLYLQYLLMLADAAGRGEAASKEGLGRIAGILSERELTLAGWDYLILPEQLMPALAGPDENLESLKADWADALLRNRYDERLSVKNRLYAWRPTLVFRSESGTGENRTIPGPLANAIRAEGEVARESVAGTQGRQSVINTISNVYLLAGMTGDARALLAEEIERSDTPYYFMGSLASLEERAGNDAVALEWRRKAYEAAEGPATRIRWWASYVQALTRLAPGDVSTVQAVAVFPFDPANGMNELFSGANYRNLKRATDSLLSWDPDRSRLAGYAAALESACMAQASGSPDRISCEALL